MYILQYGLTSVDVRETHGLKVLKVLRCTHKKPFSNSFQLRLAVPCTFTICTATDALQLTNMTIDVQTPDIRTKT